MQIGSPFGRVFGLKSFLKYTTSISSILSSYSIAGFTPGLVFDFENEIYKTSNTNRFNDSIEHVRNGNATMVDSDGVLKWAPHNLALNSATPATQSITVVSGADYTVECTGVSIALSGAGTGTVTEGNPVTITASTATLTLTVTGSSGTMWAYRSDLGGMVNNPDTGDSYVPTTSSAVYLPRRGHHVYNGSAWVNEGLLHESEQRVNLFTYNRLNDAALQSTSQTLGSNVLIEGSAQGITAEVVATGLENGTPYLDWQISGTENGTGTAFIDIVDTNSVAAAPGDQATVSGYFKLVSGSIPADNYVQLYLHWRDAANVFLSSPGLHIGSDIGGSLERFHFTATAPANTTQIVNKGMYVRVPQGETVNFTIRVALLQVELATTPSSPMLTTGSTATRPVETLTIPAANLPWPTPEYIGPELVTNGTFDTDTTGWTALGGASIAAVDGRLVVTGDGGFDDRADAIISTEIGKVYLLEVDYVSGGPARFVARESGGSFTVIKSLIATTPGRYSLPFVAISTNTIIQMFNNEASAGSSTFDNISVREISPLAVSIQMDGRVTYADEDSFSTARFVQWQADLGNRILLNLDTDTTATGDISAYTEKGGSFAAPSTADDELSPGTLVPFNFSTRHTSTVVQIASQGTATTVSASVGLPDLSAIDLNLGFDYMGTIKLFRMWSTDLGDPGIEEAST